MSRFVERRGREVIGTHLSCPVDSTKSSELRAQCASCIGQYRIANATGNRMSVSQREERNNNKQTHKRANTQRIRSIKHPILVMPRTLNPCPYLSMPPALALAAFSSSVVLWMLSSASTRSVERSEPHDLGSGDNVNCGIESMRLGEKSDSIEYKYLLGDGCHEGFGGQRGWIRRIVMP